MKGIAFDEVNDSIVTGCAVTGFETTPTDIDIDGGIFRDVVTGTLHDGNLISFILYPNNDGIISLIPEPSSLALLSLATLLVSRRLRKFPRLRSR